ncbi:MAG: hypothetical protein ACTHK8_05000 [Ginsengibacter sp.]
MNEKNLQYLKDNLKYMGFGEKLNESLEANISEGKPSFELQLSEKMHRGNIDAKLHFRQSPSTGMYFFNSYEAHLVKENGFERNQQFYLNNGKGVTLKEAYNLLDGRSVLKDMTNKEGVEYKAWLKLDFDDKKANGQYQVRQFHHEKYGFDLKKELQKFNLSELPADKEMQLLQSLQKGNRQAANFDMGGENVLMYIEANPQFKTLNLIDPGGNQLTRFEKEQYMVTDLAMKEPEMEMKGKELSVDLGKNQMAPGENHGTEDNKVEKGADETRMPETTKVEKGRIEKERSGKVEIDAAGNERPGDKKVQNSNDGKQITENLKGEKISTEKVRTSDQKDPIGSDVKQRPANIQKKTSRPSKILSSRTKAVKKLLPQKSGSKRKALKIG